MLNLLKRKKPNTFDVGGVHPAGRKLSASTPIETLPLPKTVAIFLAQHIGAPADPIVERGAEVKVGQVIAKSHGLVSSPLHASVSGKVTKIEEVMDVTGFKQQAIVINVTGDEWLDEIDTTTELKKEITADRETIIRTIQEKGVVGLGGAGFPAHVKLTPPEGKKAEFLLINGVECEPYLTADHRIMLERGEAIIVGIRILMKAAQVSQAFIGIENNKADAIAYMSKLVENEDGIEVKTLKTRYPQGGERQLIKAILNREVPPPPKGLPIDVGCIVFNIATTFAIYQAIQKNKPLVERVVTVTGQDVKHPANLLTRIGTPIMDMIKAAGGVPEETGKVVAGGPMMGKSLNTIDSYSKKGLSGLLLFSDKNSKRDEVHNCIRCGKCVSVCPLGMEPYLLMALTERSLFERAEDERILNCCECACCSYICPSRRPLLDYIRYGKATVMKMWKERQKK